MRLQSDEAEAGSIWKASSLTPLAPGWARAHSPGARGGGPSWGSWGLCAVPPAWGPGLPAFPHCGSRVGVPSCGRASENWKVHSRHVCSVEARGGGHPPGARVGERSMNNLQPVFRRRRAQGIARGRRQRAQRGMWLWLRRSGPDHLGCRSRGCHPSPPPRAGLPPKKQAQLCEPGESGVAAPPHPPFLPWPPFPSLGPGSHFLGTLPPGTTSSMKKRQKSLLSKSSYFFPSDF